MTNGMYYQVDMKNAQSFDEIPLTAGGASDHPRGYQVFVSNDGVNFGSAIASGTGAGVLVTVKFPAQNARFVKVVQTGTATSWWSISEYTSGGGGGGGGGTGGTGSAAAAERAAERAALAAAAAEPVARRRVEPRHRLRRSRRRRRTLPTSTSPVAARSTTPTRSTSGVMNPAPQVVYQSGRLGNFSYALQGYAANSSHTLVPSLRRNVLRRDRFACST